MPRVNLNNLDRKISVKLSNNKVDVNDSHNLVKVDQKKSNILLKNPTTRVNVASGAKSIKVKQVKSNITVVQVGRRGPRGEAGAGVPDGGTTNQVLAKKSNLDQDTEWVDQTGGGGAVDSVNGQTGAVILDYSDVGADQAGSAAAAESNANDYTDDQIATSPHPYYQYIYNSSSPTQNGNVFNNFADMLDAIDGREVIVQFQQDEVIPVGHWNFDYQTWKGNGQNPDSGGLVLEFPEGCYIDSAINISFQNGLNIYSSATTHPTYTMTAAHAMEFNRTAIYTDDIEFVKITATGLVAIQCSNGFGLYNDSGAGLGNYEVFNIDSVAYGTVVVTVKSGTTPNIQNNTIRSVTPVVYGWLIQTSEAHAGFATHSNLAAFSVNFDGIPGGEGGALFTNASVVGFIDGQPTGIISDNVADALAELYAKPQAYSRFIYNSSGTQDGNRYNDWADLMAAIQLQEGRRFIQFEQDETLDDTDMPVDGWNLDFVTLNGNGSSFVQGTSINLTLADGFKIESWVDGEVARGMFVLDTSTTPVYTIGSGTAIAITLSGGALIASMVSEFFNVSGSFSFLTINGEQGSIANPTPFLGSGYEVINATSDAQITIYFGGIFSGVFDDSVRGDSSAVLAIVRTGISYLTPEVVGGIPELANLDATFANFTGGVDRIDVPKAANLNFDNTTSGLTAENVQDAIDEVVAMDGGNTNMRFMDDDLSDVYSYVGYENVDDLSWYIYRRTRSSNVRQYASGASNYSTNWSNRAILTYI